MLVGAELRGMRGVGIDHTNYAPAIRFLNRTLGTKARFRRSFYLPRVHTFMPPLPRCDVAVVSAVLCHLPDPLNFLAAVANRTRHALLFWGQLVDSNDLLVSYRKPHAGFGLRRFPYAFNDNTRLSRGLFAFALSELGFTSTIEIEPRGTWLLEHHDPTRRSIKDELSGGSRHFALLAIR
jgi:hypothetical protein